VSGVGDVGLRVEVTCGGGASGPSEIGRTTGAITIRDSIC
jgi:hypothetical protein